MKRVVLVLFWLACTLAPVAHAQSGADGSGANAQYRVGDRLAPSKSDKGASKDTGRYREVKWEELVSPDWNPQAIVKSLNLDTMLDSDPRAIAALERLRQEWDNAPGNATLNGAEIRLPGFVVPLERDGKAIREFLLVPYFGACIHVPPPPANQIVHVVSAKPVANAMTMDAVWVSGKLKLFQNQTHMGRSGYRLEAARVEPYAKQP